MAGAKLEAPIARAVRVAKRGRRVLVALNMILFSFLARRKAEASERGLEKR